MSERLLIIALIAAAVYGCWLGVRWWQARRVAALAEANPLQAVVAPGRSAVVAFSTPGCAECRGRQAPALRKLEAQLGAQVAVYQLSVPEHPELVAQLGILTVPATAVVDAQGRLRALNLGFADERRLAEQLVG